MANPWQFGEISKDAADELLQKDGLEDGKFLVRIRPGHPEDYVLAVVFKGRPTHHLVQKGVDGMFTVNKKSFGPARSISEVVALFQTDTLPPNWPVKLASFVRNPNLATPSSAPAPAAGGTEANDAAGELIMAHPEVVDGLFFVRGRGADRPGEYVITVVYKGKPTQHLVRQSSKGEEYTVNGKACTDCTTLGQVVKFLRSAHPFWPVPLKDHVPAQGRSRSDSVKSTGSAQGSASTTPVAAAAPLADAARREAEDKARREAEDKARREVEGKARREAEDKARREAEDKARREAEDKARREAEDKARREAEESVEQQRRAHESKVAAAEAEARRKADEESRILRQQEAEAEAARERKLQGEAEAERRAEATRRQQEARQQEARQQQQQQQQQQQAETDEAPPPKMLSEATRANARHLSRHNLANLMRSDTPLSNNDDVASELEINKPRAMPNGREVTLMISRPNRMVAFGFTVSSMWRVDAPDDEYGRYNIIKMIEPGSPAETGKLEVEDIIKTIDGMDVSHCDINELKAIVRERELKFEVVVVRPDLQIFRKRQDMCRKKDASLLKKSKGKNAVRASQKAKTRLSRQGECCGGMWCHHESSQAKREAEEQQILNSWISVKQRLAGKPQAVLLGTQEVSRV
ncbi:uncharacterized protein MONBRDRAFT_29769 [Monosiga brevicollis MX1]|uniref:SH2 domain-containing protein n=1 Tax=Monosiga brevicollis TaxID=81824 RepID=A9VC25_MONBE|nr:uncharacterized protein MONBRDRAFT_29769 [Monosiga brevicollis MX1]EDQ84906.1 predicted protein [Monosiga brevicollis MX1]|eukprot:XP_001750247.1 hypothetical protein [Monosiga brevicollis MX1]